MSIFSEVFPPSVQHFGLHRSRGCRGISRHLAIDDDISHDHQYAHDNKVLSAPIVAFGRLSATTIRRRRRKWDWIWLIDENENASRPQGVIKISRLLIPPMREPRFPEEPFPLDVLISSATQYIHSTPDIYEPDVVAQLVAEELAGTYNIEATEDDDLNQSGLLAVIKNTHARYARVSLCFTTGQVGQELNVSAFLSKDAKVQGKLQSKFVPTGIPIESFPTPILQLAASSCVSPHRQDGCATALLVRLASSTHLLNLVPNVTHTPYAISPPVTAVRVAELSVSKTEGRRHIDVALDPLSWSRAAVVDHGGGVWLWWEEKPKLDGNVRSVTRLRKIRDAVSQGDEQFFCVAFGTYPGTVLVLSRKLLISIDINDTCSVSPRSTVLVSLKEVDHFFTSLDKTALSRGASFTCVCTNKEVLWIDESTNQSPVLRWQHEYGETKGNDLNITIIGTTNSDMFLKHEDKSDHRNTEVIILSSASKGHMEAFRASASAPAKCITRPWSIFNSGAPVSSISTLPFHNNRAMNGFMPLVGRTSNGGITLLKLFTNFDTHSTFSKSEEQSDNGIWDMERCSAGMNVEIDVRASPVPRPIRRSFFNECWSTRAQTRHEILQCRWLWSSINESTSLSLLEAAIFQRDIRESDAPFEHIMTAADLARDSAYLQPSYTRSGLLRSVDFEISDSLHNLIDDFQSIKSFPFVRRFDQGHLALLKGRLHNTHGQNGRLALDCLRLKTDLTLSFIIVTNNNIASLSKLAATAMRDTVDDLFAHVTGLLSLEEKAPDPVAYCILAPRGASNVGQPSVVSHPTGSETLQSLLADWKVGQHPSQYSWRGHFVKTADSSSKMYSHSRRIRPLPAVRPLATPIPAFRPLGNSHDHANSKSNIYPVQTTDLLPARPQPFSTQIHSLSSPPPTAPSSPSPQFFHTQIERGPYGARPEASGKIGKRKATKKRHGGF